MYDIDGQWLDKGALGTIVGSIDKHRTLGILFDDRHWRHRIPVGDLRQLDVIQRLAEVELDHGKP